MVAANRPGSASGRRLLVGSAAPAGLGSFINRDQGLYFYAGQQVADGHLPYVNVFNRSGPGAHLAPGVGVLLARLLGTDELTTLRVLYVLVGVATVTIAYILGRDLFGRWPGLVAPAALLGMHIFVTSSVRGFSDKLLVTLITEIGLLLLLRGKWLMAGLTIGVGAITWQPALLAAAPAAAAIALLVGPATWKLRLRRVLMLMIGGAAPLALCLAVYAAAGRLQLFLDCFMLVNSKSATPRTVSSRFSDALRLAEVGVGSATAALVGLVGLVMIVGLAIRAAASSTERATPEGAIVVGFGVYTVCGVAWTMLDFDSGPDLLILAPAAALGLAGLVHLVSHVVPQRAGQAICVVLVAVCLLPTVMLLPETNDGWRVEEQREVSETVIYALPDDATVLSIEAPQAMALTGRTNPTRFQLYGRFVADYLDRRRPGGYPAYRANLRRSRPEVVVVGNGPAPPWVERMLAEDGYTRVATAPMLRFWVVDEYADTVRAALPKN